MINLAFLIPCHNESISIKKTIEEIKKNFTKNIDYAIFIIDNNSTDNTAELAKEAGAHVLFEPRIGKGFALLTGFSKVNALHYIIIDGDNTYDTVILNQLYEYLETGKDHVIAYRKNIFNDKENKFLHNLGNYVITKFINIATGQKITDSLSGFRGFSRRFIKSFIYDTRGFEIESYFNFHSKVTSTPIFEIQTNYRQRLPGSMSKLSTFKDGLRIIMFILRILSDLRPGLGTLLLVIFNLIIFITIYDPLRIFFLDWFVLILFLQLFFLISILLRRISNSKLDSLRQLFINN